MENENCLAGVKCPECGAEDSFDITVETVMTVHDDGTDTHSDVEWTADSLTWCPECGHRAPLGEFSGDKPITDDEIEACRERIYDMTRNDLDYVVADLLERMSDREIREAY